MLTIYTDYPGGYLVPKHKTIKFDEVGNDPLQRYRNQRTKENRKPVSSNYSPYFVKLSRRNGANHLIFQTEFPNSPCDSKYPWCKMFAPRALFARKNRISDFEVDGLMFNLKFANINFPGVCKQSCAQRNLNTFHEENNTFFH